MKPAWQVARPHDLLWVEWEDACAAYHRPSGKTHFLNPAAVLLLRQILVEPTDAARACALLMQAGVSAEAPDMAAYVTALLLRLEQIGLVRRVTA